MTDSTTSGRFVVDVKPNSTGTITNFGLAGGVDKIDLSAFGYADFSQVRPLMYQIAKDVFFILPQGQLLIVKNVQLNTLSASNFIVATTSDGIVMGTPENNLIDVNYRDIDGDKVSSGNDSINSGAGNDTIESGAGNDTVNAGVGNDIIRLGDGDDRVFAEDGNDTIDGGAGNDLIDGGKGADSIDGGAGNDTVTYNSSGSGINISLNGASILGLGGDAAGDRLTSVEAVVGSTFNDTIAGSESNNTVNGGEGNDLIYGWGGADFLLGEAGNDTIIGGTGRDTLFGLTGNDRLEGGEDDDVIAGEQGDDLLLGGLGNDRLIGDNPASTGRDSLYGGSGNDTLEGGAGDDFLSGDDGDDIVFSGIGNDVVFAGNGRDSIFGDAGDDSINAGDGIDTVIGGDGDDNIQGEGGNDQISGDAGNDTLRGGLGNDVLFGYSGNDNIIGDDGDDVLAGEAGDDTLSGGRGNDVIYTDGPKASGYDLAFGDDGNDVIKTGDLSDTLFGGTGDDTLFSEADDDIVYGGSGNDSIDSGSGNDRVFGDEGNDTILTFNGNDSALGGSGDDNIYGLVGNDTLDGGIGKDRLYGDVGDDSMLGGSENDLLDGWHGRDTLDGGTGNDTLAGGDNNDLVNGGDGNDLLLGERQQNTNSLPTSESAIIAKLTYAPDYKTWGLLYQGEDYNVDQLKAAKHEMIIINPAKDADTTIPQSEHLWSQSEISSIKSSGKLVFGYVNVAKMNSTLKEWNASWTDNGLANGNATSSAPSWFSTSESSTTRLVNFQDTGWQNLVMGRVETMINQGFQGILLDDVLEYFVRGTQGLSGNALTQKISANAVAMRDFVIKIREFADVKTAEKYGKVTEENRFQLVANGAPYLLQDALLTGDINTVLANAQSQAYLKAIDTVLIENYFARNTGEFIKYTIDLYGKNGVSLISIDTDQVTLQQREQIITDAVNAGILPYTTINPVYDTLNNPFLQDLKEASIITSGDDTLNGGAGNDTLNGGAGSDTLSGGTGADIFIIGKHPNSADTITDFATNEAGEKIDLSAFGYTQFLTQIKPLMTQNGADVLVALPNSQFVVLKNIQLSTLTADDFVLATNRTDGIVSGTNGNDAIRLNTYTDSDGDKVTTGADNINGGVGNDTIDGNAGNDTMTGGAGADVFVIGKQTNTTDTITDFATTQAGEKIDLTAFGYTQFQTQLKPLMSQVASDVYIALPDKQVVVLKNVQLSALTADDFVGVTNGNPIPTKVVSGTAGNDFIYINYVDADGDKISSGNDSVDAGAGNDIVYGGSGTDTLSGGSGNDIFLFNRSDNFNTTIVDFVDGVDKINIMNAQFTQLSITNSSAGATISMDGGADVIHLMGISASQITQADFL